MRRMMAPEMIIKSQVVDDKNLVDLNEILEKYGTVTALGDKTITLQIYNKFVSDEEQNRLEDDSGKIGNVVVNGSITIGKFLDGTVYIQGTLLETLDNGVLIPYLEILSGSYENGIMLISSNDFDLYVIRV